MEGIEKITDRIAADTASEIEQIQQQARAEADAISARYAAEAERVAAQILARGRRSCEEKQAQMLSSAALSAEIMQNSACMWWSVISSALTGRKVPSPTCSVIFAMPTPFSAMA